MPAWNVPADLTDALRNDWGVPGPVGRRRSVTVSLGPLPPVPEDARSVQVALPEWTVEARVSGDDVWLGGALHLCAGPHGADLTVTPAGAGQDVWAVAFTEIHRAAGWVPLHAALVGGPAGAVAITGPSGAGKSTACLRLQAAGWTVLAEDRAWFGPAGQVLGLDRVLRAFDDSLALFAPQDSGVNGPRDSKGKRMLPLPPAGIAPPLVAVLLLGDGSAPEPAERVRLAWEASGVPLTASGQRAAQDGIQRLVRGPAWQAVTRADVPDAVASVLARLPV